VVYLPAVTQAEAQAIAERLCASVALLHIEAQGSQIAVTVSIGLAWVHDTSIAADRLFKSADDALYQAKQSGRNRVVLAADTAVQGA